MIKEKKYRGWDNKKQKWEEFISDNPKQATPEASGYDKVEELGEYDENKDTLYCTHKGCNKLQGKDGEFCKEHIK